MATYTALFAGLSLSVAYVGLGGFDAIIGVFSFLAVCICLNGNSWFVRNISMIGAIENELLIQSDYGKIVPQSFKAKLPFFTWGAIEKWWLFVPMFSAIPLLTYAATFNALNPAGQILIGKLLLVLFITTVIYGWSLRHGYRKFVAATSKAG